MFSVAHKSYVGALGPMGLYGPITTLWNGGADQLKFPALMLMRSQDEISSPDFYIHVPLTLDE